MVRKRTKANAQSKQPAANPPLSVEMDGAIAPPAAAVEESDEARVVDAVVDRRELEVDHPEPIHPMAVVSQHLGETQDNFLDAEGDDGAIAVSATRVRDDESAAVSVEAIALDWDPADASDTSGEADHAQAETVLSGHVAHELSAAIATAHQHEAELEAHLTAIDQQQAQLQQELTRAQAEIVGLQVQLTVTQAQEMELKQQMVSLKAECDRTTTQLSRAQAQLAQQTTHQQELEKLKIRITTLTTELEEAKCYILQLTQARAIPAQPQGSDVATDLRSLAKRPIGQRPIGQRPIAQRPERRSLDSRPQPLPSYQPSKSLAGLPPMSTERLNGSPAPLADSTPEQRISRTSERLRPAYTRPGFSNTPSDPLPQNRQPLPQLQAPSQASRSSSPHQAAAQNHDSALAPRRRADLVPRRSRPFDEIRPELKSSQLPRPKVSDTEIGWFD
ncbi:MAG: hypothetical protein VKJ64_16480 [Leptolyngbyaceae bacterium]|nr:hypothetical protein [Leptolyngbyaceae bacterium]